MHSAYARAYARAYAQCARAYAQCARTYGCALFQNIWLKIERNSHNIFPPLTIFLLLGKVPLPPEKL